MPSPSAPTPRTARFQEKREAILGSAARLFNERGVRGATLSEIAASVGLVTNSVTYYHRTWLRRASCVPLQRLRPWHQLLQKRL